MKSLKRLFVSVCLIAGCAASLAVAQEGGAKKPTAQPPAAGKAPAAAQAPAAALPKCPVMGEEIDFSVRAETPEGPVYFCCPMCIGKFEKEPAKFADAVKAQREALAKRARVQTKCPVSGKPVDGKTSADVGGHKVSFCCAQCVDKYKAEPAKYKGALEGSYTYQTKCPVSGEDINPTVASDLSTGQRVYFCCKDCIEKFNKDAAKYAPKLAEQGVHVDVKKLQGK
ncbi:MAG: hypothetical protein IT449_18760 [Phycisphaerales bacterium]|nr:hypothetical protein [Phycisphaerales bacterium]